MLLVGKQKIEYVKLSDIDYLTYFKLEVKEMWKIPMIQESMSSKVGELEVPVFEQFELYSIFHHLCTE